MNMQTEADEHRRNAIKHLEQAIRHLGHIVVDRCWGYDDYTDRFYEALREAFSTLLDVRDSIDT